MSGRVAEKNYTKESRLQRVQVQKTNIREDQAKGRDVSGSAGQEETIPARDSLTYVRHKTLGPDMPELARTLKPEVSQQLDTP